jgi:hypothetical protein
MRVRPAVSMIAALVGVVVVAAAVWPSRSSHSAHAVVNIIGATASDPASGGGAFNRPQDAAIRYVAATRELIADGPIGRREILRHLMTADGYARAIGPLESTVDDLEGRLRDEHNLAVPTSALTWVEAPLTVRTETITPDTARCEVWTLSVFGATALGDPQAAWRTVTLELRRDRSGWLVERAESIAGPAPSTADLAGASDFERFARVAAAQPVVGAGG